MTESLHDLMIIKKEIEGMVEEINEIRKTSGLSEREYKLDMLKRLYQAELKECVAQGVISEGTYRIINTGRKQRAINTAKVLDDPELCRLLRDKLTITLRAAMETLEELPGGTDKLNDIIVMVTKDNFDVIDMG